VSAATRWRCPESVVLVSVSDLTVPLPFALIWQKDNHSPLLRRFLENVRRKVERGSASILKIEGI
jgi:DNA-binding transcriptional LysR family regulator